MILPGFRFLWRFSCECPLLFVTLSPRNRDLDETDIFLFVVLLVVMTACGGKKQASVDAEQLMFQIDSVDHVTGLQRMQVSRIDQHIVSGGKNIICL